MHNGVIDDLTNLPKGDAKLSGEAAELKWA